MKIRTALGLTATLIAVVVSGVGGASPAHATVDAGQAPAPSFTADDYHEIVNTATDKCVDVVGASKANGALIHQWDCERGDNQLWASNDLGNGYVQFFSKNSGKCMNLVLGTVVVNQQTCISSDDRQWWRWRPADVFGNLVLQAAAQEGPCLALRPFSNRNGTMIGLADCATTSAQIWHSE